MDSLGTEGNAESLGSCISSDGRFVGFSSLASNLVSGDTNGVDDIFVRDRTSGLTTRLSVDSFGIEGNARSLEP